MKKAFTLAEVLITLGIVGIIAAMTLPALTAYYKKVETSSRLKKFVSEMEQAIRLSEIDNGSSEYWTKGDAQSDYDARNIVSKEFFMTYLAPYFRTLSIVDRKNTVDEDGSKSGTELTIYLSDGSKFTFHLGNCMDIIFDSNGDSKPNEYGRDKFVFFMCFGDQTESHCGNNKKNFCTPKYSLTTRTEFLNRCKNNAYYCSILLEYDNWEFKSDYPYKL